MFRSLHIGIDRYSDRRIAWLSGAARDASALHALFTDTFGTNTELLTDDEATGSDIRDRLTTLAIDSHDDDVVVVTYAGHGSRDHYLVPYDCDVDRIAETGIALDELADLISKIPGSTLLCALDCCFSGGLGSRVFSPDGQSRDPISGSTIDVLDRFTGVGRVVLTAAADDQEAMESSRHGHGLLTFRLIEALQGAAEVRHGDQVNLYEVVQFVTQHVESDAAQMGRQQTPTLRGKLDGTPLWPMLVAGPLYGRLFPDRVRAPASADLSSLNAFGIPAPVLAAWAGSISKLNDLQLMAINDYGVLDGENLVVTAPTSSGKTLVGELAALKGTQLRQRAIFLLPMRALVNDKYEQFTRMYSQVGLRTIRATGEHTDDIGELLRGQFDLALLTYETFAALALGNRHILGLAGLVVVDEAQMLTDRSRGSNLEFLMTMLNESRGRTGTPQIITLSAVVGDIRGLDRWLGGRHLAWTERPVPLVEGVLDQAGRYRHIDEDGSEAIDDLIQPIYHDGSRRLLIPLVQRLRDEGKKVFVFRQSKGESIACAVYLSQSLAPRISAAVDPSVLGELSSSSRTLLQVLDSGIAFHNADLNRDERRTVEELFRDPHSKLSVVVATPTLAMGINTPAAAVAIVGLTHPGRVPTPYTVAEYKNMVGRAGRLGYTDHGESYVIPEGNLDSNRAWNIYVKGTLEDLKSQLVPDGDPRSLMLRVLASQPADVVGVITEADVLAFLDASFAAFQAREGGQQQWNLDGLRRAFSDLLLTSLIVAEGNGYRLTELGRFTGQSGTHVDSIVRLVNGLRGVGGSLNSVGLIAAAELTNELNDIYLPVNARARNTEVPRWPNLLLQQGVPNTLIRAIQNTSQDGQQSTSRCKRASAAALWVTGIPVERIEQELNQHMYRRGGLAGAIRATVERTRDLLPAVAAVLRELAPSDPVDHLVERTQLRLELGLPPELIELAARVKTLPSRTQWMKLHEAGIRSVEDFRKAPIDEVGLVIGDRALALLMRDGLEDDSEQVTILPPLNLQIPSE